MKHWTTKELMFLERNINKLSHKEIADKLGRNLASVRNKITYEGLTRKRWTDKEIKFLKDNLQNMSYKEIATELNRPVNGVNLKSHYLGLAKEKLSAEDKKYIISNFNPEYTKNKMKRYRSNAKELSKKFNITEQYVRLLYNKEGIA